MKNRLSINININIIIDPAARGGEAGSTVEAA
jgi:hypothetical protein